MKREDIEKAAGDYSGSSLGFADNNSVMAKHKAFADGAQWRINTAWHKVNEEPTEKKVLVVIDEYGNISQSLFMVGVDAWKDFVEDADIVNWCYKEDLLPNTED